MPQTLDIGERIELVSMDPHFHDISIGLYREDGDGGPVYRVHSYASLPGFDARIAFICRAMQVLGGVEPVAGEGALVRFSCGQAHQAAVKRLFLEACKLDPAQEPQPRPLRIFDKKAGCDIAVRPEGNGAYSVSAAQEGAGRRVQAVVRGLAKLGEMEIRSDNQVAFACGQDHDALVALLLVRAPNVRAVMREEEQAANRGQLTAPGNQDN